jgi:hypothetical protein
VGTKTVRSIAVEDVWHETSISDIESDRTWWSSSKTQTCSLILADGDLKSVVSIILADRDRRPSPEMNLEALEEIGW